MRHCWGTTTIPIHDPVTTRTGRETCERETAAWVHWYNTRRPLPLGGITPQQAANQHTTTRKEAASTSLHKTRDLTHPLRGIAPVTSRCTRYVAIHPLRGAAPVTSRCTRTEGVQCLQIGCNAYTSGARPPVTSSDADLPEWRSTDPPGLAVPGNEPQQATGPSSGTPPTTNRTRQRRTPNNQQGPRAAGPDRPSRRRAERAARGARAASSPGASLPRHQARARRSRGVEARARGTHATSPGTTRAYDEAGTRRAKQRGGPRPRQQVRPGDPP